MAAPELPDTIPAPDAPPADDASETLRIMIGVPSYDGRVHQTWVNSLLHTVEYFKERGHTIDVVFVSHTLIEKARDRMTTMAFRSKDPVFDYVLMIDSDIGWGLDACEAVEKLMLAGAPVIAGAVPKRSDPLAFTCRFVPEDQGGDARLVNDVLVRECITIGSGFMAISTKVLRAISPFVQKYDDRGMKNICRFWLQHYLMEEGQTKGRLLGEDATFVLMCRNRGIPTFCPIAVSFTHDGYQTFGGEGTEVASHLDKTLCAEDARAREQVERLAKEQAEAREAAERMTPRETPQAIRLTQPPEAPAPEGEG
jgi:hypothetical protein